MGLEDRLGEHFNNIDKRFGVLDERLDRMENQLDNVVERMDSGFDTLTQRLDRTLAIVESDKKRLDDHEKRLTKLELSVDIAG